MIKKIFHLADVHIPNNVQQRPYMDMLKQALSELYQEAKKYEQDEIRIAVVGDIYHNKIRVSNEATNMFHKTLNYLNAIGKTILVAGNHDMLENNQTRIDSISPTFEISDVYPNITYADKSLGYKSGCIVDDNVIWVLYSMYDKFVKPNVEEVIEANPDKKVVGLFHGDIAGATTDTGRTVECGIDTDSFECCDCVMAGHIHKHQEIKKNGVPLVYSGSLFQQNSGENTTGHGFLIWDVETMSYKLHEVTNNYKTYKFKITDYTDVTDDVEKLLNL